MSSSSDVLYQHVLVTPIQSCVSQVKKPTRPSGNSTPTTSAGDQPPLLPYSISPINYPQINPYMHRGVTPFPSIHALSTQRSLEQGRKPLPTRTKTLSLCLLAWLPPTADPVDRPRHPNILLRQPPPRRILPQATTTTTTTTTTPG